MLRGEVCLPPNRNVPDGLLPAHNQFPTTLNSSFASLPSRSALVLTVIRKSFGFRIEFWRSTPAGNAASGLPEGQGVSRELQADFPHLSIRGFVMGWQEFRREYPHEWDRYLFLAKITIGCRIKYINRVSNSALSHVKLALCSAH